MARPADLRAPAPVTGRFVAAPGDGSAYRVVHVVGTLDDVYRLAPVATALDAAGDFQHVVVDATHGSLAAGALAELAVAARLHPLPPAGHTPARRLGALLDGFDALLATGPTAAIVYAADDAARACALSAARHAVPLVQVEPRPHASGPGGALVGRIADVVFAIDADHEQELLDRHVPRHRIHVVGDALPDLLRTHAAEAAAADACRRHGVERGAFALVALDGPAPVALTGLTARLPLLVVGAPAADDPVLKPLLAAGGARRVGPLGASERLGLEHAAGVIVTDSPRVAERAAVLDVPCRLVTADGWTPEPPRPVTSAALVRDDGGAQRLAASIVTRFTRVTYAIEP